MTHLRDFFRIAPSNNDHHPAIRCLIGVGVPLLALLAIGRTDLSIFAVLGAFTGVYGRSQVHRVRFSQQWRAGVLLLTAVTAGLTVSHAGLAPETIVVSAAAVGALGFLATRFGRLSPDGSLFYVFAFSAIAFMPAPAPFSEALAVTGASVLLSLVVGVAGEALPAYRTPWVSHPFAPLSLQQRRETYIQTGLHFAAIAFSGAVAIQVGFGHSYWAMIAATAALVGATAAHRIARGLHRIIGTFAGLAITGLLLSLNLQAWQMVLAVLVLQFLVELFITRHYALAQTFVTPLALLMTEVAAPTAPWALMRDRAVETVIGASAGMALVILVYGIQALRNQRSLDRCMER